MMDRHEVLLERLRPLMSRAGITRVANITGLDDVGIPVVMATRPGSRSLSVSQGKGLTLEDAKISAIMESLEQYFAERIHLPLILGTLADLRKEHCVVDVELLARTTRAFDDDARLLWIEALDLETGRAMLVPFETVHLDLGVPLPEGSGFFVLGSNGLASGFDRVGAVAHGVWELIERDAIALFYERPAARQAARRVALSSIADPRCQDLLRRLERAGLAAAVWDVTTEIGIATFLCAIGERQIDPLRRVGLARGSGCHPDRAVALRRAITEAAQSRLTRIAGSRDDMQVSDVESIRSLEAIERHRAHVEQETLASWHFEDVPSVQQGSTREALEFTLQRLREVGFPHVLTVELTPPDESISVVRTIVPGLEGLPDGAGYAPGYRVRALRERGTSVGT